MAKEEEKIKILVTGAAGFIGSHVARVLVKNGCDVYALDLPEIDAWRINDIIPSLHFIRCGLQDYEKLGGCLKEIKPDICIHLAWYMGPGYLSSKENVESLRNSLSLASLLADIGCKKFVGAGTCFEYDINNKEYLSETSPTKSDDLYRSSKLALYSILENLSKSTSMEMVWLRFFDIYGPFESKGRLVPHIIISLLNNEEAKLSPGEQIRDYMHVEDLADAVLAVIKNDAKGIINIASGKPISIKEMAVKIGFLLDRPDLIKLGALEYRKNDPMFICADNKKLLANTNWAPKYDLETGLSSTIDWWKNYLS